MSELSTAMGRRDYMTSWAGVVRPSRRSRAFRRANWVWQNLVDIKVLPQRRSESCRGRRFL